MVDAEDLAGRVAKEVKKDMEDEGSKKFFFTLEVSCELGNSDRAFWEDG